MESEWCVEYFDAKSLTIVRAPMRSLPFSVGRRSTSDLVLSSQMVSADHAEIVERQGCLWVHDRGSTNGTYVNGERISAEYQRIREGDILHFADVELRLVEESHEFGPEPARILNIGGELSNSFIELYRARLKAADSSTDNLTPS